MLGNNKNMLIKDVYQHIIDIYQQIDERRINMSEREKQILATFKEIVPKLSPIEQERLLSFGEGMAFKLSQTDMQHEEADQTAELIT